MPYEEMVGRINAVRYGNNINVHERRALSEVAVALRKLQRAALESEKPLAEGWAMPAKEYYIPPNEWINGIPVTRHERQIRVYLGRAPKGSKPVTIYERKPDGN